MGGAATGLQTSLIDIGSDTIETLNVFTAENNVTNIPPIDNLIDNSTVLDNNGWGDYFEKNNITTT
jgi:hypothetical protein